MSGCSPRSSNETPLTVEVTSPATREIAFVEADRRSQGAWLGEAFDHLDRRKQQGHARRAPRARRRSPRPTAAKADLRYEDARSSSTWPTPARGRRPTRPGRQQRAQGLRQYVEKYFTACATRPDLPASACSVLSRLRRRYALNVTRTWRTQQATSAAATTWKNGGQHHHGQRLIRPACSASSARLRGAGFVLLLVGEGGRVLGAEMILAAGRQRPPSPPSIALGRPEYDVLRDAACCWSAWTTRLATGGEHQRERRADEVGRGQQPAVARDQGAREDRCATTRPTPRAGRAAMVGTPTGRKEGPGKRRPGPYDIKASGQGLHHGRYSVAWARRLRHARLRCWLHRQQASARRPRSWWWCTPDPPRRASSTWSIPSSRAWARRCSPMPRRLGDEAEDAPTSPFVLLATRR